MPGITRCCSGGADRGSKDLAFKKPKNWYCVQNLISSGVEGSNFVDLRPPIHSINFDGAMFDQLVLDVTRWSKVWPVVISNRDQILQVVTSWLLLLLFLLWSSNKNFRRKITMVTYRFFLVFSSHNKNYIKSQSLLPRYWLGCYELCSTESKSLRTGWTSYSVPTLALQHIKLHE